MRRSKADNRKSDMSVISSFEYERDENGNPVSIVREDGCVVYYEYDAKNQLTAEIQRDDPGQDVYAYEWDYDAAGNREYQTFNTVTTYYEYDAANELTEETTAGDTTYYQYDDSGNTVAKQEAAGTTYYQYDHENLMTRIDFANDSHNYFAYDADSKRVKRRDSEGYARFIYQGPDMLKLLQEQNESEEAGLVAYRELDEKLGLTASASQFLTEQRTGRNIQHEMTPLLRQSVYSRLAGYADTNDADRLARDPAMRLVVSRRASDQQAAARNTVGRFETEMLSTKQNRAGLTALNAAWVSRAMARWSLTTLRGRLVKIGARLTRHARQLILQMAEVAVTHDLFEQILSRIRHLSPVPT